MIKFHGTGPDGGEMLGIGLSRKNCERLLAGKPIEFRLEDMQHSTLSWKGSVVIIAGETEEAMALALQEMGALDTARVYGYIPDEDRGKS